MRPTSSDSRNWFDTDLIPGTSTISGVVAADQPGQHRAGQRDRAELERDVRPARGPEPGSGPEAGLQLGVHGVGAAPVDAGRVGDGGVLPPDLRRTSRSRTGRRSRMPTTRRSRRRCRTSANDPTLDGVLDPNEILTVYNLNSAKRSVYGASQVDYNSTGAFNTDADQSIYNGFEVSFSARLAKDDLFGGWTMEKNVSRVLRRRTTIRTGRRRATCTMGTRCPAAGASAISAQFDMPFRHEFKLSGSYPLPYGVDFGAVLQATPASERTITWQPPASLFPGGRTNTRDDHPDRAGLGVPAAVQPARRQLQEELPVGERSGSACSSTCSTCSTATPSGRPTTRLARRWAR